MFNCYLCEKETVYTAYFCDDCQKIKNIMNVYSKGDVLSILSQVCLRNKKQVATKVEAEHRQQKDYNLRPRHTGIKGLDGDQ
jgi:hypothetical protein